MSQHTDPHLGDDASGEAWFQKGTTLLQGRKEERETEARLLKAMNRSLLQELMVWPALTLGLLTVFQLRLGASAWIVGVTAFGGLISFINAIDIANAKRTMALLQWLGHQREKEDRAAQCDPAVLDASTPSR